MFKVRHITTGTFLGCYNNHTSEGKTWKSKGGAVNAAWTSRTPSSEYEIVEYEIVEKSSRSAVNEIGELADRRAQRKRDARALEQRNKVKRLKEQLKIEESKLNG